MTEQNLMLDPNIRDFVFLPMVVIMLVLGLAKTFTRDIMGGQNESQMVQKLKKPIKIVLDESVEALDLEKILNEIEDETKHGQAHMRSQRILSRLAYLPEKAVRVRKSYFCRKDYGIFQKEVKSNPMGAMLNPNMMTNMMKSQFSSQIFHVVMFMGLGYLFSGFILAHVPFPFSHRFRPMLQQGFTIPQLHVSYVSSMSWSILLIFGLNGVQTLLLKDSGFADDMKMMANPLQGMQGGGGQPKDFKKIFETEKDTYELIDYKFQLAGIEKHIIHKHKKLELLR